MKLWSYRLIVTAADSWCAHSVTTEEQAKDSRFHWNIVRYLEGSGINQYQLFHCDTGWGLSVNISSTFPVTQTDLQVVTHGWSVPLTIQQGIVELCKTNLEDLMLTSDFTKVMGPKP